MIDPLLALTFNLEAQPGIYALLLGSGLSRASGIPTGWEITLDLVGKLAALEEQAAGSDPVAWYRKRFGQEPDYSKLLSAIATTSAAQQTLLKGYFEPTEKEREASKKGPTDAHRAIAKLVKRGLFKVIVTTNFDRLLEVALEQEGIAPTVVSSPDAIQGAPPLAHGRCTVVKLHGDYLDSRIKNSPADLANYDQRMDRLLDQILAEYGFIACGWSADYDTALRNAIERAGARRYPMYWTTVAAPSEAAQKLIALHRATVIPIDSADQFFVTLQHKIEALEEYAKPHPLSTEMAVAELKNYLVEERHRIRLSDMMVVATNRTLSATGGAWAQCQGQAPSAQTVPEQLKRLEAASETLVALFAVGAAHASETQYPLFLDAFKRLLSRATTTEGGFDVWQRLRSYPSLLLAYAVGVVGLAIGNLELLARLALLSVSPQDALGNETPVALQLDVHRVLNRGHAKAYVPEVANRKTPFSDYLFGVLREPLRAIIPDDAQYQLAFDRFEYLWALTHIDLRVEAKSGAGFVPYGSFIWRCWSTDVQPSNRFNCAREVAESLADGASDWPPLAVGFFGNTRARLKAVFQYCQGALAEIEMAL
jgi:hypothetical protein